MISQLIQIIINHNHFQDENQLHWIELNAIILNVNTTNYIKTNVKMPPNNSIEFKNNQIEIVLNMIE